MNAQQKLTELNRRVSTLKSEKSQTQGQLTSQKAQLARVRAECKKLGVEPDKIAEIIVTKEKELAQLLETVESAVIEIEKRRDSVASQRSAIQ